MSKMQVTPAPLSLRMDDVSSSRRDPYVSDRGVSGGYKESLGKDAHPRSSTKKPFQPKKVPGALQAGSPVNERGSNVANNLLKTYPPPSPYDAPLPARPEIPRPRHQSSVSSIDSDDSAAIRWSLPTALQPATRAAYRSKFSREIKGPSPMTELQEIPANPRPRDAQSRPASSRSLLSGLGSLRSPRSGKRYSWRSPADGYAIVDEGNDDDLSKGNARLSVRSHQYGIDNTNGYDITSFEGPPGLQKPVPYESVAQLQTQGTLAAEFHQLEAGGTLTGGLGGGMVVGAKLELNPASSAITTGSSRLTVPGGGGLGLVRGNTVRDVGQREAKERGEIIAIRGMIKPLVY